MTDLRQRFEELDRLDAPDMRADIERRAAAEPAAVPPHVPDGVSWRRGSLIAVATAVAVFVVVAVAVLISQSVPSPVIETPTSTVPVTSSTVPVTTSTVPVTTSTIPVTTSTIPVTTSTVPTTSSTVPVTTSTVPVEGSWLTWSRVPYDEAAFHPAEDAHMFDVVAGGPGFVAVGDVAGPDTIDWGRAGVWTSVDGVSWTLLPNDGPPLGGPGGQRIESITVGGPGLVAVGVADEPDVVGGLSAAIWSSEDGTTWSRIPYNETAFGSLVDPEPGDSKTWMRSVTQGGPGLVAVGDDALAGAVWTSQDGFTWTRVPHDPEVFGYGLANDDDESPLHSVLSQVVTGPTGLVAVSGPGTALTGAVWTSPDGLTWSVHPGMDLFVITATPAGYVGFGTKPTVAPRPTAWTSPDGITWTQVPHDEPVSGGGTVGGIASVVQDVATVGDRIVAVGGSSIWTSPDGRTWTREYEDPAGGEMRALAATNDVIVVVGDDGASETRLIGSPEGDVEGWFSTASVIVWVGTAQQPG